MKRYLLQYSIAIAGFLLCLNCSSSNQNNTIKQVEKPALFSIETGYTVSKVRTAKNNKGTFIVASSYEGTVLGVSYDGAILWKNELSGFMNHDIWCEDINADGIDEILVANANGTIFCLNSKGETQWQFKKNDAPMYALTVINKDDSSYVVCGGFDKNLYYLSNKGELLETIPSSTYSIEKPWGKNTNGRIVPEPKEHISNFIKTIKKKDGSEVLVVHGLLNSMSTPGTLYLFNPLEKLPFRKIKVHKGKPYGELSIVDSNNDGDEELILGSSTMVHDAQIIHINLKDEKQQALKMGTFRKQIDNFGYRVVQSNIIQEKGENKFFILLGARIIITPLEMTKNGSEVLACKYSFNDMWKDANNNKIVLASAQSGGSSIHVINLDDENWKKDYEKLNPSGKIASILGNTEAVKNNLKKYNSSIGKSERTVYFMTESRKDESVKSLINSINSKNSNPQFLNGFHVKGAENWDRSNMPNEAYKKRRDRRKEYNLTQQEVLDFVKPKYDNNPGVAYWGGHGNDPYMFSVETTKKVLDMANGKKTVLIYPEMEDHSKNFEFCLNDLIYPVADYAKDKNANIFLRNKHVFWQGSIYIPEWKRLMSGDYADVFVPAMEETTDKSMELSVAGRMGIWASGAVNNWGARCARDNTSYDRLRQHSHQTLPNHFLRQMVYSVASGATFLNNFAVDQEYFSLLYKLIDEGAIYVPKRSEIVSFSPVHLSIVNPDEHYLNEGNNVKWLTFYDEQSEKENPMVFSRLNGSWPGAELTEWDFSRYAAGAKERRLNFLPKYNNGLVLITPAQKGVFAEQNLKRGLLEDNLHPLYKNILKEYITDGRNYISSDGKETYSAKDYYKTVEAEIKNSAKLLPLTVEGDVAWVVAQTSPTTLRLTIIDNGYLNPDNRKATITFNTVTPVKMKDILDGTEFNVSNPESVKVDVPCGMFRFMDIELSKKL